MLSVGRVPALSPRVASRLLRGLSAEHASALRNALASEAPVALTYVRDGRQVNAVVGPAENGRNPSPAVIAEFIPFPAVAAVVNANGNPSHSAA
jgi:hypothetical protein